MHVTLTVKNARRDENLEELFEREKDRIVRRLSRVPLDLVSLQCEIDLNPHLKEGYASLTLKLPTGKLNARGVGRTVLAALRDAVEDMLVELDRHRNRNRREQRSQKAYRLGVNGNGELDQLLEKIDAEQPADTAKIIRQTLGELYPFVRRQLTRHSEVLDRPECNSIDVADVVEEAVLRALSRQSERPADVPFDRWLFSCAYDVIVSEEDSLAERDGSVSLEDELAEKPLIEGPTSGEEIILDQIPATRFFADILPADGQRSPEDEMTGRDLRAALMHAIRHLPDASRRVLSLVALEGLEEREAARRLRCSEASVRDVMAGARIAVREELAARGFDT